VTDALGGQTAYGYDGQGNVITVTDANGHATSYEYDQRGRLVRQEDPAGGVRTFAYDASGNRTAIGDELDHVTSFEYDEVNRLLSITNPMGASTSHTYDAASNLLSTTDPLDRTTSFTYDELDRLTSTTDPQGSVTTFEYDAVGNRTSVTDPLAQTSTFAYDALDRVIRETDALGHSKTYAYDAVGNLTGTIDRNDRKIEYEYDLLDRLTAERWFDGDALVRTIESTYGAAGNLLTISDPDSAYAFTYDALNRLTSSDNAGTPNVPHVTLSYVYDAVGNRLTAGDQFGINVTSEYDPRNLLIARTWEGPDIDSARVEFQYDAARQLTEMSRFADATGDSFIGRSTYQYDAAGRLENLKHLDALDAVIAEYDYVRDLADQLVSETHHGQTSTYSYDSAGQLTGADHSNQSDEAYTYDANGNRVDGDYVVGPNNQVLSDGTFEYAYDAEGNLIRKTEIATGEYTEYEYDHRNRLVRGTVKSAGGIILKEVMYAYDALDRRIARTVDSDGAGPMAPETVYTVYDGAHAWADFDSSGNVVARYLFGERMDEIIARYRPTEGTAWYLTDHLGTVRDIVDAAGGLINHIDYDSFGYILAQTNPLARDRFTFTGREWEPALAFYYYRARFYDPQLGRFVSQDPLGFAGGDINLYRYVNNDPLGNVDPLGLANASEESVMYRLGPVGAILLSRTFLVCVGLEVVGFGLGAGYQYASTGEITLDIHDAVSLTIGVVGCAILPVSALSSVAFVAAAEALHLFVQWKMGEANATDAALLILQHTLSIVGGRAASRHAVESVAELRVRPPRAPKTRQDQIAEFLKQAERANAEGWEAAKAGDFAKAKLLRKQAADLADLAEELLEGPLEGPL